VSLFDFILIALVAGSVLLTCAGLVLLIPGNSRTANRMFIAVGLAWILYFAVGTAVAYNAPPQTVPIGANHCYNGMCYAVVNVQRTPTIGNSSMLVRANGVYYVVTMRVTNVARIAQKGDEVQPQLTDAAGNKYEASHIGAKALALFENNTDASAATLQPGQSMITRIAFDVPPQTKRAGLALTHADSLTPSAFLLDNPRHFLHKPAVVEFNQ
jgi:hypothetical protein